MKTNKKKTALDDNEEMNKLNNRFGVMLYIMLILTLLFGGSVLYNRCERLNQIEQIKLK